MQEIIVISKVRILKGILVLIQESTKFNELAKINQYISTSVFKNHEIWIWIPVHIECDINRELHF